MKLKIAYENLCTSTTSQVTQRSLPIIDLQNLIAYEWSFSEFMKLIRLQKFSGLQYWKLCAVIVLLEWNGGRETVSSINI